MTLGLMRGPTHRSAVRPRRPTVKASKLRLRSRGKRPTVRQRMRVAWGRRRPGSDIANTQIMRAASPPRDLLVIWS